MVDDVVNRAQLLANFKGMESLIPSLIAYFLKTWPVMLSEVELAAAENDFSRLERAAHSLKGAVSNFRAGRAVAAALRIEVDGRRRVSESVVENIDSLRTELEVLSGYLQDLAKEYEIDG